MAARSYTLSNLLAAASAAEGVPIPDRTAQQYLDTGILVPIAGGKPGRFAEGQVLRLRLALRLAAQYVPLREIRLFVDQLSPLLLQSLVDRPLVARLPSEGDTRAYLARLLDSVGPGTFPPRFDAARVAHRSPGNASLDHDNRGSTPPLARRSEWLHVEVEPDVVLQVRLGSGALQHIDQMAIALRTVLTDDATCPPVEHGVSGSHRQG